MRISRRPSGGRGEYEISGSLPSGELAGGLENHLLSLEFPGGLLIHTRVRVKKQGGKLRLRRADVDIQLQKQLAAAFMMPDPARQVSALGAGEPLLQEGAYAVDHIEIESILIPAPKTAVLRVKEITVINRSHLGEVIRLQERAALLQEIWAKRSEFPDDIALQLSSPPWVFLNSHFGFGESRNPASCHEASEKVSPTAHW
ncbi:MAG: hypothetical protein HYX72_12070 [Acidobacteria bacterium]|nr:hypothetical protein [Acidobacteriota bacterium]